ncbi:MAG: haloalkane dehalogenase [Ardenticatenaceae bacterium]|nr:haloalkane dehalogenase [Ardenticatenaceae bacterium]
MDVLRTPDERFENLPDFPFPPHYTDIDGLRVHHIEDGPASGDVVLMLHGEPSWSFLYRHMIPVFAEAGCRAIAPDLPGFGKSDKLTDRSLYSYQKFVDWMAAWIAHHDLQEITLVCQDWGSLIGLRLVAEHSERFARVVLANGGMPTGDQNMPEAFLQWREFSQNVKRLPVSRIVNGGTTTSLSKEVLAGYDAPFPDESYKEAARIMPALVPITPNDPASDANRAAWRKLMKFDRPFLTAFSDGDPITAGGDAPFKRLVKGAKDQPHTIIEGAGHFLQEDKGPEFAKVVVEFIKSSES